MFISAMPSPCDFQQYWSNVALPSTQMSELSAVAESILQILQWNGQTSTSLSNINRCRRWRRPSSGPAPSFSFGRSSCLHLLHRNAALFTLPEFASHTRHPRIILIATQPVRFSNTYQETSQLSTPTWHRSEGILRCGI